MKTDCTYLLGFVGHYLQKISSNCLHKPNLTERCTDVSDFCKKQKINKHLWYKIPDSRQRLYSLTLRYSLPKNECGLSVTGEIHHQHTNLLNISHLSCRSPGGANNCQVKLPSLAGKQICCAKIRVRLLQLYFRGLKTAHQ